MIITLRKTRKNNKNNKNNIKKPTHLSPQGYSELAEADKKKVRSVFWESIPRPPLTQHELEEERLAAVQRASC